MGEQAESGSHLEYGLLLLGEACEVDDDGERKMPILVAYDDVKSAF